jgi:hypothetical protein
LIIPERFPRRADSGAKAGRGGQVGPRARFLRLQAGIPDGSRPRFKKFSAATFFREVQLGKAVFLFFFLLLPLSGWAQAPGPGKNLSLVFSANVHGEVEPCG